MSQFTKKLHDSKKVALLRKYHKKRQRIADIVRVIRDHNNMIRESCVECGKRLLPTQIKNKVIYCRNQYCGQKEQVL